MRLGHDFRQCHTQIISIHAPQWGATLSHTLPASAKTYFNPRTPVGCDGHALVRQRVVREFQSTHPSGVRRDNPTGGDNPGVFQSTHPSGVRLLSAYRVGRLRFISIHAPQWGATASPLGDTPTVGISIHAPQWGATFVIHSSDCGGVIFQSTHPSGVRPAVIPCAAPTSGDISIHAPQWGATSPPDSTQYLRCQFQSTHPSGVRPGHRGRYRRAGDISIHAPQWGATASNNSTVSIEHISIHAPQWGATVSPIRYSTAFERFQSTHPSGVRRGPRGTVRANGRFQSTHPSGVRLAT